VAELQGGPGGPWHTLRPSPPRTTPVPSGPAGQPTKEHQGGKDLAAVGHQGTRQWPLANRQAQVFQQSSAAAAATSSPGPAPRPTAPRRPRGSRPPSPTRQRRQAPRLGASASAWPDAAGCSRPPGRWVLAARSQRCTAALALDPADVRCQTASASTSAPPESWPPPAVCRRHTGTTLLLLQSCD
jgi:hypothetical protein